MCGKIITEGTMGDVINQKFPAFAMGENVPHVWKDMTDKVSIVFITTIADHRDSVTEYTLNPLSHQPIMEDSCKCQYGY